MNLIKKLGSNTKSSLKELKIDFFNYICFLKNNTLTIFLIWFFILLAYGIKLFNYSISIDTEIILINYDEIIRAWTSFGRFGLIITKKLFGLSPFSPYAACFLMIVAIFLFCSIFSYLLNYFGNGNKGTAKSLLSCIFPILFLTAPLFAEQFIFILQGFEVAFAIILCSLSVFFITKWTIDSTNIVHLFLGIICMAWSFATYQAIVFLYITAILGCYILIYSSNRRKNFIEDSYFKISVLKHLGAFFLGYLLNSVINIIIWEYTDKAVYLDKQILWKQLPVRDCIKNIYHYIKYVLKGDTIFYNQLFFIIIILFIIYALINIFSKNKNKLLFFLAVGAFIMSPFFLSIYIANSLLPRMQFSFQFVFAFGIYYFIWLFQNKKIQLIAVLFAILIAFNQGYMVSRLYYSDYIEYQAEVELANRIAIRIDALNSADTKYPIVFVGAYNPVNIKLLTKGDAIGASFFEWDSGTSYGSNGRIMGFFNTLGYAYVSPTQDQVDIGKEYAKNMSSWPDNNSVELHDNLIIIKLSD